MAYNRTINKARITDVEDITGHGIKAVVDGKTIYAGNSKLMDKISAKWKPCDHEGTIIHVAVDGEYVGHIVIADEAGVSSPVQQLYRHLHRRHEKPDVPNCYSLLDLGENWEVDGRIAGRIGILR